MSQPRASGACLCGGVTFTCEFPSNWVAHCHCTMCRRAHGAAFVTWVSVGSERARIEDPGSLLRWFASSSDGERAFCGRCGSSLFFRSGQWPGELHVVRANFTDPVDQAPGVHAFFDSHVDWITMNDDLPRMSGPES
jgi:hypothetical protein